MFRIEVCFLILILASVVVCQNVTSTASSGAATTTTATTATAPTTTTSTTQKPPSSSEKPDLIEDAFGKILKVPGDVIGAITDEVVDFGMFHIGSGRMSYHVKDNVCQIH